MDTSKDVLDTPLEVATAKTTDSARHTPIGMLKLDFGISAILLLLSLLTGLASFFERELFLILMILAFFLGSYQLLSGLIGGIRGNRKKLIYVVAALVYLAILSGIYMYANLILGEASEVVVAIIALVLIPLAFALYYTKLCYDAIKAQ